MSGYCKDSIDWEEIFSQLISLFKQYLKVNTTNPPGNEIMAANFFKDLCIKEGIDYEIFESSPGRGNIIASLKGSGKKEPIILLNHMDVVPAEASKWSVPTFEAIEKDGFIYNRGTLDMKSFGILQFMTLILLKRSKINLNRDIIFIGCADEEAGGKYGASYLIKNVHSLKDASFCINEGSSITKTDNGDLIWEVAFNEKIASRFCVKVQGTPGHGSVPHNDNCNLKLVKALERINNYKTPIDIIPIVKSALKVRANFEEEPIKSILEDIDEKIKVPENVKILEDEYPHYNALIRDTFSLTILKAGTKDNVIPSEAYAFYDARILPGHKREDFINQIKELVKDLPVEIEMENFERPVPEMVLESEDSEFYKIIKEVASNLTPGALVSPTIMMGASDSQYMRSIGIPSYGFAPFINKDIEHARVHGNDERISVENMRFGIKAFYLILKSLAT